MRFVVRILLNMVDQVCWNFPVLVIVILVILPQVRAGGTLHTNGLWRHGANVCEERKSRSVQTKIVVSYQSSQTYKTKCGLFGWGRCKRSRIVTRYAHRCPYKAVFETYLFCCQGWVRSWASDRTCPKAICSPLCYNGGICVAPNRCQCPFGWTGPTCRQDINECQRNNGGCQHICLNRRGARNVCSCWKGFKIHESDNKKCTDIDECLETNMQTCGCTVDSAAGNRCGAKCKNSVGGYSCSCGEGFHLQHDTLCTDVNECEINNGNCEHTCRNIFGRHRCQCREGYVLDTNERTCTDIDECKLGDDDCEDHRNNTVGGYMCSCRKGYQLKNDNRTCTDIDECAPRNISGSYFTTSLSGCHHLCSNVDGSFQCSCRNGYTLMYDRRRCKDMDECVTGNHSCMQNCHNTDGSYRCSCKAGFKLLSDGMSCEAMPCEKIEPPRHGEMVCSGLVTDAICTFSCKRGYYLVGSQSRTCLPSSRWSGNWTSCKAKHCQKLTTKLERETLSVPCFSSFGSICYFGCRPGFFLQGDGQAKCSLSSKSNKVSWKIGEFSCEEIKTCQPNPCRHGGKCSALDEKHFNCNCEGTGYRGNQCQYGFISVPVFPKLRPNITSRALHLLAYPSKQVKVSLHSAKGVTFEPLPVDIRYSKTKGEFTVKSENLGIQTVTYSIEGESKDNFQTPRRSVFLVAPEISSNDRLNQKLLLPKEELPIGCEGYRANDALSCEIRLLSTAPWIGSPPSTSGIVHFASASDQNIPLSLIGLNMKSLNASWDEFIDAAIATTSSKKEFTLSHQMNGACHSRIANSENLLELMDSDAFVSSFMQTFSKMAPKWFKVAVSETNNVFHIGNIAGNLGSNLEHCLGFPLSQRKNLPVYRPAVYYKMFISENEVDLFADGKTCFAVNICKPAVFISFPKQQALLLKSNLNVFRDLNSSGIDLRVDAIGLLNKKETSRFVKGTIWDGRKLHKLLPFNYNMWLKGSVQWTMEVPELLYVKLKMIGEKLINVENLDTLFTDRLSQPLEMQFKGKAFVNITGKALKKDFTMKVDFTAVNGKAVLGGGTFLSSDNVEGIFLTLERPVSNLLIQSPLSTYVRPKETEPVCLAILMSLNGGRRLNLERVHEKTDLKGISLSLQSNLCIGKLCFNALSTTLEYVPERNRFLNTSSVPAIRAKGKLLKTIPLGNANILSLQSGQVIEMVFPRDSGHVSANFQADIRLFGTDQSCNVTLDEAQLSFEIEGKIFNKYLASMKVVAKTNRTLGWNSLVFLVEGRMVNSSLLSRSLTEKINNFAKYLAKKAFKRVQDVEKSFRRAKQRVDSAKTLVREKEIRLNETLREKQRKNSKLQGIKIAYEKAKSLFNPSLAQFLKLKKKRICALQNCNYINTSTCIPAVCQKEVVVSHMVPNCHKVKKKIIVDEIVQEQEEHSMWVPIYEERGYSNCGRNRGIGKTLIYSGIVGFATFSPLLSGAYIAVGLSLFKDSISGCDIYYEKVEVSRRKVESFVTKTKLKSEKIDIEEFECDSPKKVSNISWYDRPFKCCKNNADKNVKVLDPKCVFHNSHCLRNMTLLAQEIEFWENQSSHLQHDFQALVLKGKNVTITQLELNKAEAEFDFASNQLKFARASLKQHEYAQKSIDITTVRSREKLGLELGEKLKSLKGSTLISVESLVFSVSMARTSTKMLFPLTAYLRTSDGLERRYEFSMDFANGNHSLNVAARRIVETLLGTTRSRERRSAKQNPISPQNNDSNLPLGQFECLLSQEAHSFFSEVIESLEFAVKSSKELEGAMIAGMRGLEKLSLKEDNDGVFLAEASQEIWAAFNDTVQSLKESQLNSSMVFSWNNTLNDLLGFLDVLSRENNFTECSGFQDCIDFFFDNLEDMYEMEYHPRAIEIKQLLKELEKIIGKLFKEGPAVSTLEAMISQAKLLVINSRDNDILCGKKPNIERSSPTEVVTVVGENVKLVCEATSTLEVEYVWIKNGQALESTNNTILELKNVTPESEGAYKCQVSNRRGSTVSNVTIVMVHLRPNITEQPRDALMLVGEQILSLVCNSTGVPRPLTDWFFIPMKEETCKVFRINSTNPVLELHNLTTENSGFYFCNVSNFHGIVQSRMARVDVLRFAPGVPRIAVGLKLKKWPNEASSEAYKSRYNINSSNSSQQVVDPMAFNHVTKTLLEHMSWPLGNVESQHYSPFPNASVSFVIKGGDPSIPDDFPSKQIEAALNSFSLSRRRMWNSVRKLFSALDDENFMVQWKNLSVGVEKESLAVGFPLQMCPNGTSRHENGFLCVNCAPGHYGVANRTCLQCPSGTYQPDEGRRNCLNCPFPRSLTQPGARLKSQCIDISIPCNPPNITTTHVQMPKEKKNSYRSGETILLGCKVGYKGVGSGTQECNEGNWTSQDFYCEKTCSPSWTEFKKRCYKVIDTPTGRWKDASAKCQFPLRARVVSISSEEKNEFAVRLAKEYLKNLKTNNVTKVQMWLGLRKKHPKAQFQWVDGTSLNGSYINWAPGEPNNDLGRELCTAMLMSGNHGLKTWSDVKCNNARYKSITICEKPL